MYLSRLILNPSTKRVQRELHHPYEMHRTLMKAFPDERSGGSRSFRKKHNILFRADIDEQADWVIVYVQSDLSPDWSFLGHIRNYLVEESYLDETKLPNPAIRSLDKMLSSIREGMELAFRIRANPTKRVARKEDPLYGKRVGLLKEDEQIGWLIRKGREREREKPGGFEILMTEVSGPQGKVQLVPRVDVYLEGNMKGRKKGRDDLLEMTHTAVKFEGALRVTNAAAFRETLRKGIGSGKAYGFGLLSIAPVRQ